MQKLQRFLRKILFNIFNLRRRKVERKWSQSVLHERYSSIFEKRNCLEKKLSASLLAWKDPCDCFHLQRRFLQFILLKVIRASANGFSYPSKISPQDFPAAICTRFTVLYAYIIYPPCMQHKCRDTFGWSLSLICLCSWGVLLLVFLIKYSKP